MAFPNSCCGKSMESYDSNDDFGSFEVLSGRDAIGEQLRLKCRDCKDEWSREYSRNGDRFWIKTKEVGQPS